MRPMELSAGLARHQLRTLQENMATAIATSVFADSLFRKRAHCFSPCIAASAADV
jgi:hypothetical protein